MTKLDEFLTQHGACADGAAWARQQGTLAQAWAKCRRPSWMLWALAKICGGFVDARYRLLACRFARETPLADGREVWDLLTDERSRAAVEAAERHAVGLATDEELYSAWCAAGYAARDAAGYAARAAAGKAARDAAWDAAGYAARAAAGYAARAAAGKAQCGIIRDVFPNPFEKGA
jgi:hypothetical protein